RWNERHRYHHDETHLREILIKIEDRFAHHDGEWTEHTIFEYDALVLTAIFHDIVYNPLSTTNEEESAKVFIDMTTRHPVKTNEALQAAVKYLILSTRYDAPPETNPDLADLAHDFFTMDAGILVDFEPNNEASLARLLKYEQGIYR